MQRPALLAFDVNETLLSLAPVKARLATVFGEDPPVGEWFARMLHGSLVANETDTYRGFGAIGAEALLAVATKRSVDLSAEEAASILGEMDSLPPHPDVPGAMERLSAAGFPMVTLTNGSSSTANAQVDGAGLRPFIDRVISVEDVGKFKPSAAPYHHAAEVMGVEASSMMLVASHDWDCLGAAHAGCEAAFVARPGVVWSLPFKQPSLVVGDIGGLAAALLE